MNINTVIKGKEEIKQMEYKNVYLNEEPNSQFEHQQLCILKILPGAPVLHPTK